MAADRRAGGAAANALVDPNGEYYVVTGGTLLQGGTPMGTPRGYYKGTPMG